MSRSYPPKTGGPDDLPLAHRILGAGVVAMHLGLTPVLIPALALGVAAMAGDPGASESFAGELYGPFTPVLAVILAALSLPIARLLRAALRGRSRSGSAPLVLSCYALAVPGLLAIPVTAVRVAELVVEPRGIAPSALRDPIAGLGLALVASSWLLIRLGRESERSRRAGAPPAWTPVAAALLTAALWPIVHLCDGPIQRWPDDGAFHLSQEIAARLSRRDLPVDAARLFFSRPWLGSLLGLYAALVLLATISAVADRRVRVARAG